MPSDPFRVLVTDVRQAREQKGNKVTSHPVGLRVAGQSEFTAKVAAKDRDGVCQEFVKKSQERKSQQRQS